MKVFIEFSHVELIVGDLRSGEYELPEGSTLDFLLDEAERESGRKITVSNWKEDGLFYSCNKKYADTKTVLHEGDRVKAMMKLLCG
ncbi:MAG: hypothetical protein IJY96_08070 [Oscillospiraceae bacterium]|nr:hypothetical protein [Oscillospiraceae bacterium]